ncbi:hypothetical protein L1987_48951 [Smallanthus sonchifolius]|uniref:Uncharacterized protein n=1 Tax=Smallanthus sonchifolius TaxID=185202 RepID=A0ACB9FTW2_9ASTR|nr:hypothetical protein L1987_48951 [Smallanthus sonchifolius]
MKSDDEQVSSHVEKDVSKQQLSKKEDDESATKRIKSVDTSEWFKKPQKEKSPHMISSYEPTYSHVELPKIDLHDSTKMELHNPTKDKRGYEFENFLRRQRQNDFESIQSDKHNSVNVLLDVDRASKRKLVKKPKEFSAQLLYDYFLQRKSFRFSIQPFLNVNFENDRLFIERAE